MKKPILAICIPTYNRSEMLQRSLDSIVTQEAFLLSDNIEIIISDNCSADNTKEIAEQYIKKFGCKIKYYCNKKNVNDENFVISLRKSNAIFSKLSNDTIIYNQGSLELILNFIKKNMVSKPVLFFPNKNSTNIKKHDSLDTFVKDVSFISTWIGGFGIWDDDKSYLLNSDKYAQTKLWQTYILLKMISVKKLAVIFNHRFCVVGKPSISGNYNLSEVFIRNYLSLYLPYLDKNMLSHKTYEKEKWLVFKKHVLPRQFNVKHKYHYDKSHFWTHTEEYHKNIKFYLFILRALIKKIKISIKYLLSNHK